MVPVLWLPDVPFDPLHEPPAVHELGLLVALHEMVALEPVVMAFGESDMETPGIAMTDNVAEVVVLPAAFEHVRLYVNVPALFITPVL